MLQSSDPSLKAIAQRVDTGAIDVAPKYLEAQSELIESFLLTVPVPPVYLAEDDFGTCSVIGGKQRITTIRKFLRNELTLKGSHKFGEVNGPTFQALSSRYRLH